MEANLASLVVAILQASVKSEISGVGWRQMPKAEVGLGQCARQRLALVPDSPRDHGCVHSLDERSSVGVAISGCHIWFPEEAPSLGQRFSKGAMSLSSGQEIQKIAMFSGRGVPPFTPRALAERGASEPDEE